MPLLVAAQVCQRYDLLPNVFCACYEVSVMQEKVLVSMLRFFNMASLDVT